MNWSVPQWKLPYEFLIILSIFRGKFYCLSLATVAVDINPKILKENGILLSQFAQNIVEAHFLRNVISWDYLLGYWFEIMFPKIWLYFYMSSINNIYRSRNIILFWSVGQDHRRFEVSLLLIYFIKHAKSQEPFINAPTLPK